MEFNLLPPQHLMGGGLRMLGLNPWKSQMRTTQVLKMSAQLKTTWQPNPKPMGANK
jgi:hypothetical protein